jgi:hypothetical protein
MHRRSLERFCQPDQLRRSGGGGLAITHGESHLDHGGEDLRALESAHALVGESTFQRVCGRIDLSASELHQRHSRLGHCAEFVRLTEGRLCSIEVPRAQPDLTELFESTRRDDEIERAELLGRDSGLFLRIGERAPKPHDLRAMYPAYTGEATDRLTVAPALGRFGPLPCSLPVGDS